MSGTRPSLRPEPQARGLATADPEDLADLFGAAWDAMIELAARIPADQPSRLDGWSVRDVLVHLGSWDEHPVYASLLDDARNGRVHELDDGDARNALVVAAHHDASAEEILAALRAARDRGLEFLRGTDAVTVGRRWTRSAAGPLPVTGVLLAGTFELAVHALDVAPPQDVPSALLDAGVGALVDLAGALAARRGLRSTVAVVTPAGSWATSSDPSPGPGEPACWVTLPLPGTGPARDLHWPAVEGQAHDVLDAAAGRRQAVQLVLSGRLRLHDVPALLRIAPAVEETIGLPGGAALRVAARTLSQTADLLGRLSGVVRRPR